VESWDWDDDVRTEVARIGQRAKAARPRTGRAIGPWLGGIVLGVGGYILGVCMPYSHPVGLTISAFWWAIYFGCFGIWLGSVLGMFTQRAWALVAARSDGKVERARTGGAGLR
jgi:hypothetical protein